MKNPLQSLGWKKILVSIAVLLIIILLLTWAQQYFTQQVFHLDQQKFKLHQSTTDTTIYKSNRNNLVKVTNHSDHKQLNYEGEDYLINPEQNDSNSSYLLEYPSGNTFSVVEQNGSLRIYDKHGDWIPPITRFVGDERILLDGEEKYLASTLVRAAYEEYHQSNGNSDKFIAACLILIYGWCGFRYERFQRVLFIISYRLWVQDPEPSDFYFFMCKVGGIAVMVTGTVMMFQSFEI